MDLLVLYFVWWAASRVWAILGLVWLDKKLAPGRDTSISLEETIWIALPFFLEVSVLVVAGALASFAIVYGVLYAVVWLCGKTRNYIDNRTSITKE